VDKVEANKAPKCKEVEEIRAQQERKPSKKWLSLFKRYKYKKKEEKKNQAKLAREIPKCVLQRIGTVDEEENEEEEGCKLRSAKEREEEISRFLKRILLFFPLLERDFHGD